MKRAVVPVLAAVLLSACATAPSEPPPDTRFFDAQVEALRAGLPGNYSNFTQAQASGNESPVIDVVVRALSFDDQATFLVSRRPRGGAVDQHQLYWFSRGPGDSLRVRFAPLSENQLSLPLPQLLASAEQRFRPGCELPLVVTPDGLSGETEAARCRFSHPEHGDIGLLRELRIGRGELVIAERLLDATGQSVTADGILALRKHRPYSGWAGIRAGADIPADDPSGWRLSQAVSLWDDGATWPLQDAAGDPLDVALQLGQVFWKSDQPPVLRLAVIRPSDGRMLAYGFAQPGSEIIGLNLDWFQAGLHASD